MQKNMNIPFYMRPPPPEKAPERVAENKPLSPGLKTRPDLYSSLKWAGAKMDWSDLKPEAKPLAPDLSEKTQQTKWVEPQDYCQKALQLLKCREWRSAQSILQKGLVEVGKTAPAYHLLGLAFYHQGLFQKALAALKKACDKDPQAEYFLHLSIALNETGQYKEAKKAYEKALHLQSQSSAQNWRSAITERHNQTAKTYLKGHQTKSALQEYIKGLEFQPEPSARLQIARLLWQLNYKTTAKKYLKAFVSLYPQNKSAHLLLAGWYFEEGQIPQAVLAWENVLRIDPKDQLARGCLMKVQQMSEWS